MLAPVVERFVRGRPVVEYLPIGVSPLFNRPPSIAGFEMDDPEANSQR